MIKKANERKAEEKIRQALTVLNHLGFPRQQQNERSAPTLLSLLGLKPNTGWEGATDPLMGITPMMDFFQQHYGKKYVSFVLRNRGLFACWQPFQKGVTV